MKPKRREYVGYVAKYWEMSKGIVCDRFRWPNVMATKNDPYLVKVRIIIEELPEQGDD